MAEHANRATQKTIKEFEQLMLLRIFTADSMREIIRKHNEFEYKLRRRGKSEKVFFSYIEYKTKLLQLCRTKAQNTITLVQKFAIENTMKNHIKKLYKTCTKLFPHSLDVWNKYIDFLTSENMHADVMHMFSAMLRYHNKPGIYIRAANFAVKTISSVDRARKYLMEGLHLYPYNKDLYYSLFKLELLRTKEKWNDYKEETFAEDDPVLQGLVAEGVFRTALEKFPSEVSFLLKFLLACRNCEILQKLPVLIYHEIKENNKKNPKMWDKIARLQLSGIDCEMDENQVMFTASTEMRTTKCLDMYKKALEETDGDEEVWDYYLTAIFEIPDTWSDSTNVENYFKEVAQRPCVIEKMKPKHFIRWLNALENQPETTERDAVIGTAVKMYPDHPEIFSKLIYHLRRREEFSTIAQVMETVFTSMNDDMQSKMLLVGLKRIGERGAKILTETLIKLLPSISTPVKHAVMKWSYDEGGLSNVRRVFAAINDACSQTLGLYLSIITFEEIQHEPNMKLIESYYQQAIDKFGSEDDHVWMSYARFLRKYGKMEALPSLYWQAVRRLKPHLVNRFIECFSLWKTTLSSPA